MGQAVSYILKNVCEAVDEERSNEQNLQTCLFKSNSCSNSKTRSDHISRLVSPPSSLSCNYSSSAHNNDVKHQFKVDHSSILVVDNDKAQNSGINSSNIDPSISSNSTCGTLLHKVFDDTLNDFPSIDSSTDEVLLHELFIDPSTNVPCMDMSNDQALVHDLFIDPSSTDVPSINTSNDQALVHELFVDHSINVPSIDSSTYEAFLSKLIYAFQIHDQFKVTDSNTQAVEDKSQVPSPNNSLNTKKRRKRNWAKPRKEAAVVIERRIKHYRSSQKILLVGEGDFSFSACLARAFGSASNIVATSLDSTEFLFANYKKAHSNISELMSRGAKVYHGVDATEMAYNYSLNHLIFDRIIYNFPLAGFFLNASEKTRLKRNRGLIVKFFKNAMELISEDGEIHIAHKSCGFFLEWNLQLLASNVGLRLTDEVPFDLNDYKGYNTKYGFGGDKNFDCNPSKTYKFGFKTQKTAI